jgi:hypothetical protein
MTMKRIVKWFAAAGLIVPIVLFIASQIELYINYKRVPWSTLYGFYLWPFEIFLIGTATGPLVLLALLFAILSNVVLYTIIGVVVGGTWKLLLGPRRVI